MNKVFLYMVIHDLKHPVESLRDQLKIVNERIGLGVKELMPLIPTMSEEGERLHS